MSRMLIALLAILVASSALAQTTWYVDDDAPNDPSPGDPTVSDPNEDGSAVHPFDAIQEGIDAAVNADTVLVLDGTYRGPGNSTIWFSGKSITLRSANGPDACTVDCEGTPQNRRRFCKFDDDETADTVLRGFTITGGRTNINGFGGALYLRHASPTILDCRIVGNEADNFGGGIFVYHANPLIVNCQIRDNISHEAGGGLSAVGSDPCLINCEIVRNTAFGEGGGLDIDWAKLFNCAIVGNVSALDGGGISYSCPTDPNPIVNCTVAGNTAAGRGGGLYAYGDAVLANCVFWNNTAAQGAQIALVGDWWDETTILYSNIQGGADEIETILDPTLIWGNGNIDAEPRFVHLSGQDVRVGAGSPCIDAGDNTVVPADILTDLDGNPRFWDDRRTDDTGNPDGIHPIVDMGAYEFGSEGCPDDDGDGFVTICHIPPGHPERARTITVPVQAAAAHLAHGDYCGPCNQGSEGALDGAGQVAFKPTD